MSAYSAPDAPAFYCLSSVTRTEGLSAMSMEHSPGREGGRRFLRRKQVLERLGIGSSTLHDWIRRGYFPKPIQLGPNTVGWFEDTLDELLTARERAANGSR